MRWLGMSRNMYEIASPAKVRQARNDRYSGVVAGKSIILAPSVIARRAFFARRSNLLRLSSLRWSPTSLVIARRAFFARLLMHYKPIISWQASPTKQSRLSIKEPT